MWLNALVPFGVLCLSLAVAFAADPHATATYGVSHTHPDAVNKASLDYVLSVIVGISSGGFVSALFFFVLRNIYARLQKLEDRQVDPDQCEGHITTFAKGLKALGESKVDRQQFNGDVTKLTETLQKVVDGKTDKEVCIDTREVFRESLRDLVLIVRAIQADNAELQKTLAGVQAGVDYLQRNNIGVKRGD